MNSTTGKFDEPTLVVSKNNPRVDPKTGLKQWFCWVRYPDNQTQPDWNGAFIYSIPEGVVEANKAGCPVSRWMFSDDVCSMSAESIIGSIQQNAKASQVGSN